MRPCRSALAILTLQYVADLINLLTGREPPFGIEATESYGGGRRQNAAPTTLVGDGI